MKNSKSGRNNPMFGKHHSDETKIKMSNAQKGKIVSLETRKKLSDINKGKPGYMLGKHLSEETKEKLRQAHLGKKASEETKLKMSLSRRGKKLKPEVIPTNFCECGCGQLVRKRFVHGHAIRVNNPMNNKECRKKISLKNKGRIISQETREKMSNARKGKSNLYMKGNHHSEETKRKLSIAHSGKKLLENTKSKISEANKGERNHFYGKKHSEETKKYLSELRKGKKLSPEICQIMSESKKGEKSYWYGKKLSPETCSKISLTRKERGVVKGEKNPLFGRTGEKSPMWKGGTSFIPYTPEFNKKLKQEIRERDNFTCQNPICRITKKSLHVHHINYNKKDSEKNNLISLCNKHHTKTTSGDREFWQLFYEEIMDMKNRNLKYRINPILCRKQQRPLRLFSRQESYGCGTKCHWSTWNAIRCRKPGYHVYQRVYKRFHGLR
jgi:hypothetical protein